MLPILLIQLVSSICYNVNVVGAVPPATPMMFVFGDSLMDVGNNNHIPGSMAVATTPPYGLTTFHRPTGRFSNGRLIPDFIAELLGIPLLPPNLEPGANFVNGINFASAGSGILNATDALMGVVSFDNQLQSFEGYARGLKQELGPAYGNFLLGKALFLVTTGNNDIFVNILQASAAPNAFIARLIRGYRNNILRMYSAGGRRIVVCNLGPIGCIPLARKLSRQRDCLSLATELATRLNSALRLLVTEMRAHFPGLHVLYANGFEIFAELVANGPAYGITDTTHACCGECGGPLGTHEAPALCSDPTKYLFWDFMHPTEAAYWIIAQHFWLGNSSHIEPTNIRDLVHSLN